MTSSPRTAATTATRVRQARASSTRSSTSTTPYEGRDSVIAPNSDSNLQVIIELVIGFLVFFFVVVPAAWILLRLSRRRYLKGKRTDDGSAGEPAGVALGDVAPLPRLDSAQRASTAEQGRSVNANGASGHRHPRDEVAPVHREATFDANPPPPYVHSPPGYEESERERPPPI